MPLNTKNKKLQIKKETAMIDNSVGNYGKHPFFVKKAAEAILKEVGLPRTKEMS